MKIFDLYSKRKHREMADKPNVYQYTEIPNALRVQIVHMWKAGFGEPRQGTLVPSIFSQIHSILCREYGLFELTPHRDSAFTRVAYFMIESKEVDQVLDVIELTFHFMERNVRKNPRSYASSESVDEVIEELNNRFREHGLGYYYQSDRLLRLDSPERGMIQLDYQPETTFEGVNQDYLAATDYYYNQRFDKCIGACVKSIENTMRSICVEQGWSRADQANVDQILDLLLRRGIIPSFLQSHFQWVKWSHLRQTAAPSSNWYEGIGRIFRRKAGPLQTKLHHQERARGWDAASEATAAYVLRMAATDIQFLANAHKILEGRSRPPIDIPSKEMVRSDS